MDKAKYADVLAGFEWLEFDVKNYRIDLDYAKMDLETCRRCKATQIEQIGKGDDIRYVIIDCPLGKGGYYYALSDSGTREAGKPVFAYHNCGGPARRLQELATRLSRRKEA
jgi:hypothetical protein